MVTAYIYPSLFFLAGFLSGVMIGWAMRGFFRKNQEITKQKVQLLLTVVLSAFWIFLNVADIFMSSYNVPSEAHYIIGIALGTLFEIPLDKVFSKQSSK